MAALGSLPLHGLALAALATIAVSGCSLSIDIGDDADERTLVDRVAVDGIDRLVVTTDNGSVDITTTADPVDEIEIRTLIRESDAGDGSVTIEPAGDRLDVAGRCDSGWFDECRVGFEITVPADIDVEVETDNGAIDVEGVAGDVSLRSDNGRVRASELTAGEVVAATDNGAVDVELVAVPDLVVVETDNGAVDVVVPGDVAYAVDATTDHGDTDVGVETDPDSPHVLDVRTDNGSITIAAR